VDLEVATRAEEGLTLSFSVRFELSRAMDDALHKGVPLFFAAEVDITQPRWYWRDKRVLRTSRSWRVAFQPLTRRYRVSVGGLTQTFDHLSDALRVVQRTVRWRLADASALDDGRHLLTLRFGLDVEQLPRPLQFGLEGQSDWSLSAQRTLVIDDAL